MPKVTQHIVARLGERPGLYTVVFLFWDYCLTLATYMVIFNS